MENLREINMPVLGVYEEAEHPSVRSLSCRRETQYEDKYAQAERAMSGLKRCSPRLYMVNSGTECEITPSEPFKALDCSGVARIDFLMDGITGDILDKRNQHYTRLPVVLPMGSGGLNTQQMLMNAM